MPFARCLCVFRNFRAGDRHERGNLAAGNADNGGNDRTDGSFDHIDHIDDNADNRRVAKLAASDRANDFSGRSLDTAGDFCATDRNRRIDNGTRDGRIANDNTADDGVDDPGGRNNSRNNCHNNCHDTAADDNRPNDNTCGNNTFASHDRRIYPSRNDHPSADHRICSSNDDRTDDDGVDRLRCDADHRAVAANGRRGLRQ